MKFSLIQESTSSWEKKLHPDNKIHINENFTGENINFPIEDKREADVKSLTTASFPQLRFHAQMYKCDIQLVKLKNFIDDFELDATQC